MKESFGLLAALMLAVFLLACASTDQQPINQFIDRSIYWPESFRGNVLVGNAEGADIWLQYVMKSDTDYVAYQGDTLQLYFGVTNYSLKDRYVSIYRHNPPPDTGRTLIKGWVADNRTLHPTYQRDEMTIIGEDYEVINVTGKDSWLWCQIADIDDHSKIIYKSDIPLLRLSRP